FSSHSGDFWADVFVSSGLPWRRFLESIFYHLAVLAGLWASSHLRPQPTPMVNRPVLSRADVVYYTPLEYLPPLDTGRTHVLTAQKGKPKYAPQPIISVPPEPDNRRQTIVAPPDIKLKSDVPLPNIVAWSHTQPAVPLRAATRSVSDLKLFSLAALVIAPPPEISKTSPHRAPALTQAV